ncbi:MAG: 4'-phosphopantetheinyl transferase superfamily protein [Desulfobacterales bacterium]|jgi:4'-phosphopantetheinyl transferase
MPESAIARRNILNPVMLKVPPTVAHLPGRPKVAILSRLARVAVRISARLTGLAPVRCEKDDQGVPQPSNGIYWSVAHKPEWVAGVVAAAPVGIDIEKIRPQTDSLYRRIAGPQEWRLGAGLAKTHLFYRVWTAKEAVLKAEGLGLRGLARCRLTAIADQDRMRLRFDQHAWTIVHHDLPNHVAALTLVADCIRWQINPGWC